MQGRFKFKIKFETDGKVEIFDVSHINFETQQVFFQREDGIDYNIGLGVEGAELIQCTGLKDKNGKLIYEGDVVKENWHIYAVEWSGRGDYCVRNIKTNSLYTLAAVCWEKCEVIGNIYQDSHLLEN